MVQTIYAIEISKGTRQGCPLSPLLFILSMEVLNNIIRAEQNIKGLNIRDQEYKLLAFTDDLAVVLEEPEDNFHHLRKILKEYEEVAGMQMNLKKKNLNKKYE